MAGTGIRGPELRSTVVKTHAKYAASQAKRWRNCHGSVALSENLVSGPPSGYALDGTEAHLLIEHCFSNGHRSAGVGWRASTIEWIHRHDTQEERLDAVQDMLDHGWSIIDSFPGCMVFVECQFPFHNPSGQPAGGTADLVIYIPAMQRLYIIDYKHGSGEAVDIIGNDQLPMYALCVIDELKDKGLLVIEAVLTIVQPRAWHIQGSPRSWIISSEELATIRWGMYEDIAKCEAPDATLVVGKWCKWCPGQLVCPLYEKTMANRILPTFNTIKEIGQAGLPEPESIPLGRLVELLAVKDSIISWLEKAEKTATALARNGTQIPGYKLVYAQAKRRWIDAPPEDRAAELARISGLQPETFLKMGTLNITETTALLKEAYKASGMASKDAAAFANEQLGFLTVKESSGNTTLVGIEDSRPAADVSQRLTFQPIIPSREDDY